MLFVISPARNACPAALNFDDVFFLIFFLFLVIDLRDNINVRITKLSGFVDLWNALIKPYSFCDRLRDVAMATNFRSKIGEIGRRIFICRAGVAKRNKISECR